MTTETSCLEMLTDKEASVDHRDATDSGAESHHDDVVGTGPAPCIPFAQKRKTGIVLDSDREAEFLRGPCLEIDFGCVRVLQIGRDHPGVPAIDETAEAKGYSLHLAQL